MSRKSAADRGIRRRSKKVEGGPILKNGKPSQSLGSVMLRLGQGLQRRVAELEAENAELRKKLAKLERAAK